jgi:hypothetical protein
MSVDDYLEEDGYRVQRPPVWILGIAVVVVGLALAMLTRSGLAANVIGYVLGSFGCVGVVALFIKVDSTRRNSADVVYLEVPVVRYLWSAVLIAGIGTCAVHAWYVATELAART